MAPVSTAGGAGVGAAGATAAFTGAASVAGARPGSLIWTPEAAAGVASAAFSTAAAGASAAAVTGMAGSAGAVGVSATGAAAGSAAGAAASTAAARFGGGLLRLLRRARRQEPRPAVRQLSRPSPVWPCRLALSYRLPARRHPAAWRVRRAHPSKRSRRRCRYVRRTECTSRNSSHFTSFLPMVNFLMPCEAAHSATFLSSSALASAVGPSLP